MKRTLFAVIIVLFGSISFASAHTYKTEGTITVLMHSNPDDDPIVGQAAALFFQITDSANKFDATKCDCNLVISKQNQELFRGSLLRIDNAPTIYGFTKPFTFPEKAVYSITVTGKPTTANLFQSFEVNYDLRVDRGVGEPPQTKSTWPWVIGGILILAGAGLVLWKKTRK